MSADQANYQPFCFLYYADTNTVEPVPFPMSRDVHSERYIRAKQEQNVRIEAYIERINRDWDKGLSFEQNLETFFEKNQTPTSVRGIIWQSLEK